MPERSIELERADWPADGTQDGEPMRGMTPEEAQALIRVLPRVSPWRVVAVQGLVGGVMAAIAVLLSDGSAGWSALYGAAAVVLPNALFARGMTRGTASPAVAAAGFLFWEVLKIGVAIAMLVIAARVVPQLNWPVLLVAMVVCMKVNWFALLWRGRR
jgi:ATP synthase protein I